jgi:benzoyl-CoA-dihydrodiol lyase
MTTTGAAARVSFQTDPSRYRHWRLAIEGPVATLSMDVPEDGGLGDGYELKLNSYDLGVDIELYDAVQRLRFEHPQVRSVVITSARDKIFCAGANIRMLATSPHPSKVNFCKFTNETRNGIEDATATSGQTYIAALNGTASGGGYELALACEHIMLIDDRSSVVSLPELPLLGVLPGTGGLTRITDKRHVRRDLADYFSTKAEGIGGRKAVAWRLVDEAVPRTKWDEAVAERAADFAARSTRPKNAQGIRLTPLTMTRTDDMISYRHVSARLDRAAGVADILFRGPAEDPPAGMAAIHEQGAGFWPLAVTRELDDLILDLRTNELELGTWTLRTEGDPRRVLAYDRLLLSHASDWFAAEIIGYLKRTLKRLDVTSRSLIALIEPGSCFAGPLLELALACDRQYMLDGLLEENEEREPARIVLTASNLGSFPMGNGLSRLASRFHGDPDHVTKLHLEAGRRIDAAEALELGLVTFAPDDLDWEDEVRIALEERASLSPDALTAMEANLRFVGPETLETKIFARLTAWQNWIFNRPNAVGPEGALRLYGTGRRAAFDRRRV